MCQPEDREVRLQRRCIGLRPALGDQHVCWQHQLALQEIAIDGQMLGDEPGACLGQGGRIGFLQGTLCHFLACSCTEV